MKTLAEAVEWVLNYPPREWEELLTHERRLRLKEGINPDEPGPAMYLIAKVCSDALKFIYGVTDEELIATGELLREGAKKGGTFH